MFFALFLGTSFAWLANHDHVHRLLRDNRRFWFRGRPITKHTGYPSEWVRAFNEKGETYVTLHLKDGKKIRGWVEEWSAEPTTGHLTVQRVGWVDEQGTYTAWPKAGHVLVPSSEVIFVEFMDPAALEYDDASQGGEV
jgi:hypothetical protein